MQHVKGKISISKSAIISTKLGDDLIKSISESPNTNAISSLMGIDSTGMLNPITL